MTTLLNDLQHLGVRVSASGGKLVIDAPKHVLTPELRGRLAEQKETLLAFLSTPTAPLLPPAGEQFGRRDEDLHPTYRRFRGYRRVITPDGRGELWQVWPERIGVVLEANPNNVRFFVPDEVKPLQGVQDAAD